MNIKSKNRIDSIENSLKKYLDRRTKNINNSLLRPLHQEIFKCLFIVTIMIIDIFVLLEILLSLILPFNIILFFMIGFIIIYLEFKIYNNYWGLKGKWSINKYKKEKEWN